MQFTKDQRAAIDHEGSALLVSAAAGSGKTAVAILNLPPRKMMGLESNGMLLSAVHTEKGEEKLNLIMLDDQIPAGSKLC